MSKGNKAHRSLFDMMGFIEDPRSKRNRVYSIQQLLTVIVMGYLAGKNDFASIERWLRDNADFVKKMVHLPDGRIPSHDTMSRICRMTRPLEVITVLGCWLAEEIPSFAKKRLAIDGKALNGVRGDGRSPVMLNVYSPWYRMFLLHYNIPEKKGEPTSLPELLEFLTLKDVMVTIDAAGTHPNIIGKILSAGGHIILPVKDNNKNLNADLRLYMKDMMNSRDPRVKKHYEYDNGHGRNVKQTIFVINGNEAVMDERFKDLVGSVALMVRERCGSEPESELKEEICYICDRDGISAKEFFDEIRAHWGIENNLHNALDTVFFEDKNGTTKDNGPANVSFLRKTALNFISAIYMKEKGRLPYQRIRDILGRNPEKMEEFIKGNMLQSIVLEAK